MFPIFIPTSQELSQKCKKIPHSFPRMEDSFSAKMLFTAAIFRFFTLAALQFLL